MQLEFANTAQMPSANILHTIYNYSFSKEVDQS